MQSWRLRDRIDFLYPSEIQNEEGEIEQTYSEVEGLTSIPAEVLTGPGNQSSASGANQSEIDARINIRYFEEDYLQIKKYLIRWNGSLYQIIGASTDRTGKREWRFEVKGGLKNV